MTTHGDVKDRLINLCRVNNVFGTLDPANIISTDLINAGLIDSMNMVKLITAVEEEFGVTIPEMMIIGELRTLEDLIKYLEKTAVKE